MFKITSRMKEGKISDYLEFEGREIAMLHPDVNLPALRSDLENLLHPDDDNVYDGEAVAESAREAKSDVLENLRDFIDNLSEKELSESTGEKILEEIKRLDK